MGIGELDPPRSRPLWLLQPPSQVSDDVRRTVGPYGSHNRLNRKHTKGLSSLNELMLTKKHTLFRGNITPQFPHEELGRPTSET